MEAQQGVTTRLIDEAVVWLNDAYLQETMATGGWLPVAHRVESHVVVSSAVASFAPKLEIYCGDAVVRWQGVVEIDLACGIPLVDVFAERSPERCQCGAVR